MEPWDFNGDGLCNEEDFAILIAAFGTTEADARWDPRCDLNGDGRVDIQDFNLFRDHYVPTAPPPEEEEEGGGGGTEPEPEGAG